MNDCTEDELLQYFLLLYKSCDDYIILYEKNENQIAAETPNTTKVACNISSNWCVHYTKN
jgi:hypothetical protein